jgi:hypothetical protein
MPEAATDQAPFVQKMGAEWRARSCARCDHRSDQHLWRGETLTFASLPAPCTLGGCACEGWTFEPKRAQKG